VIRAGPDPLRRNGFKAHHCPEPAVRATVQHMAIEFDVEKLIGKVDAITATQLPYAGSRAMNQLGWQLKSEAWPAFARRTFDRTVPFTTGGSGIKGGLLYDYERGSLSVSIRLDHDAPGGQDPSRYLSPTSRTGPNQIYVTRFSRLLRAQDYLGSSRAAVGASSNPVLSDEIVNDRIRPSFYKQLRDRVVLGDSKTIKGNRYFIVREGDSNARVAHLRARPGIYRIKNGAPSRIFAFIDPPSVRQKWSLEDFVKAEAPDRLRTLLNKYIAEALR